MVDRSSIYKIVEGRQASYTTSDGLFKVIGELRRAGEAFPTDFYLLDRCGTKIGVELRDVMLLDSQGNAIANAKEFLDTIDTH